MEMRKKPKTSGEALSRRRLLAGISAVGGGLALGFAIPFAAASATAPSPPVPGQESESTEITAWIVIHPDNTVVIRVANSEMGQGAMTGLAMLVAEELECDWSTVRTELVAPAENLRRRELWGDLSTGASRSIAFSQLALRQAGAMAREMLIGAAAARWDVPAAECVARLSAVTHEASERTVTFGAVAADAASIAPPADIRLKKPGEWKLAGKPTRRLDVRDKITGQPIYAIDVRLPGMLYAAIMQCPIYGGRLKSADESAIARMPGVRRLVRMPDAVAVVADSWWRAKRAVEALPVAWDDCGHATVSSASIAAFVREGLAAEEARIGRADGDAVAALSRAARRVEAEYTVPFLAHATMEPQNCTAHVRRGRRRDLGADPGSATALATAALPPACRTRRCACTARCWAAVSVVACDAGLCPPGGAIAKEVDAPVKLVWTREEDIAARFLPAVRHGAPRRRPRCRRHAARPDHTPCRAVIRGGAWFRSSARASSTAAISAACWRKCLRHAELSARLRGAADAGAGRRLARDQLHAELLLLKSFIDEMAHAAGADPYLYRRRLLRNSPKNLAVLDAAAAKADWATPPPAGISRGIAVSEACGSYCAQVVEVSVRHGIVRVHRVVAALDCGHVVNPLSIEMQVQGAVVYALTAALNGEITVKDGAAEQENFDTYEMLRIADAPPVETVIVPSGGFWGGVGEPPVPPVAPALCNAIFAATGKRIRVLPVKNHDLG